MLSTFDKWERPHCIVAGGSHHGSVYRHVRKWTVKNRNKARYANNKAASSMGLEYLTNKVFRATVIH